ncbi:MAG: hypothetical protein ABIJ75_03500 [Actinomycetota bacterium]
MKKTIDVIRAVGYVVLILALFLAGSRLFAVAVLEWLNGGGSLIPFGAGCGAWALMGQILDEAHRRYVREGS